MSFVLFSAFLNLSADGFVPVGDICSGLQIYRRGEATGIELGAEGPIAATPDRIARVLLDYAHHTNWVKGLAESRILRSLGDSLLVYQRLDLPIISDRDFTLRVRWGKEGQGRWIRF